MSKATFAVSMIALGLGCSSAVMADTKVPVVTSFSVLGDLVQQVGGDHVAITNLVKANGDAHVYNPAPLDAKAIASAQLVVMNGLEFEGFFTMLARVII